MEKLLKALKANSNIADYRIQIQEKRSTELFYVLKKVETQRATHTFSYNVTVYVDEGEARGQSSFTYYPHMSDETLKTLIEENVFAAKFTLNQHFDLPKKEDFAFEEVPANIAKQDFRALIAEIGKAIFEADCMENLSLSATEIFLNAIHTRIINSQGVDVSFNQYECRIETIPNYVKGREEFELYQDYSFSSFHPEELTQKVRETLQLCKDRANAIPMQPIEGLIPVILEGEEVEQFFEAFADDLSYGMAYAQANRYDIGDSIQENPKGDILNIELCPMVDGAIGSRQVDNDGVVLKPIQIIKDGKAVARHGDYANGKYLGVDRPTGVLPVLCVAPGKTDLEEAKKQPYVRCVKFSGLQVDPFSGFLGGEVRLGYYFDGEKEIPVTGFSIQGDFYKAKDEFLASKSIQTLEHFQGPKYLFIPNFKIQ